MTTKNTAGDSGIVAIAIVSGRITDEQALKALTPEARKYVKANGFYRCPFAANCWHNPRAHTLARCKRECKAHAIREAKRGGPMPYPRLTVRSRHKPLVPR